MAATAKSGFSDEDGELLTEINVTPLVDVTLVLLIVFMITVPAIVGSAPIKVDLPSSSAAAMEAMEVADAPTLKLFLRREESGEVALFLGEVRTNEEAIRPLIDSLRQPGQEVPVRLSADKGIPYGEVVKIIDILVSMNLHKISLDTKHVAGGK